MQKFYVCASVGVLIKYSFQICHCLPNITNKQYYLLWCRFSKPDFPHLPVNAVLVDIWLFQFLFQLLSTNMTLFIKCNKIFTFILAQLFHIISSKLSSEFTIVWYLNVEVRSPVPFKIYSSTSLYKNFFVNRILKKGNWNTKRLAYSHWYVLFLNIGLHAEEDR